MGDAKKGSWLKQVRSWFFLVIAMGFFSGCTMQINTVLQPTTAAPNELITVRLNTVAISGGGGGARTGELAVLLPSDWSVASSTYYIPPLHTSDTPTEFVVTSTVAAPITAPDGYQWYIAQTPVPENPVTGGRYTVVITMEVGNALGTYNLVYYVGDEVSGWTSNTNQNIEVRPDPCADVAVPTDADGNGYREISNACQLQMMQDNLSADYELSQDIDFRDSENSHVVTGNTFVPVGTLSAPFSGRFDGHHHTITGLSIYAPEQTGVGLFGYVTGQVSNLRLADAEVVGGSRVGTVVGKVSSAAASLINISVDGYATGTDMVGGLVGELMQGTVSSSYAEVNIFSEGSFYTGGLVGLMTNARLTNVYASGSIFSTAQYVGGLVGYDSASVPGSIINAYTAGEVRGSDYVGGLVGYNEMDDIGYSFSVAGAAPLTDGPNIGGLVGGENVATSSFLYTNNYWLRGLEAGIGNYSEHTSSSKWETVDSAEVFKGNANAVPFTVGATRVWDANVWTFSAGEYPKLVALSTFVLTYSAGEGGALQGTTTQTVRGHMDGTAVTAVANTNYRFVAWSDGSTANPRTDTDVITNHTISASFQRVTENQGGGALGAATTPSTMGNGARTAANLGGPIGSTINVGFVGSEGVNVLTYITNKNNFWLRDGSGQMKEYHFVISQLDLSNPLVTLHFQPFPGSLVLRKGESRSLDVDGDQVPDVAVAFSNLDINRAEITLTAISVKPDPVWVTIDARPTVPQKSPLSKVRFTRPLQSGMTGQDVLQLQKILNANGFVIARTGPGSPGRETTVFGAATKASLIAFQKKYGLAPYPGVVGAQTLKRLNSM